MVSGRSLFLTIVKCEEEKREVDGLIQFSKILKKIMIQVKNKDGLVLSPLR